MKVLEVESPLLVEVVVSTISANEAVEERRRCGAFQTVQKHFLGC